MGSVGNPNPWTPYGTYKDCSQGICSIYCPQWCYIIFPPPPPFGDDDDDDSATDFSPLIIAVIGILASAFLLVSYYTIISKYCRRRGNEETSIELDENHDQMNNEQWQGSSAGLDEALIKSITVCKYKKGDGLVEGTDCSVCLSEFQENESLRLLPKCNHAFHLPCIDTWLKSHSSCPLCRSNIASTNSLPHQEPPPVQETVTNMNTSALEHQHRNDTILVIQDLESGVGEGAVSSLEISNVNTKTSSPAHRNMENYEEAYTSTIEVRQDGIQPFRRSVSLNSLCPGHPVLIADILRASEDDDEFHIENLQFSMGIGSSKQFGGEHWKPNDRSSAMKRSISTGRFMFTRYGRGTNSIIPN